MNILAINNKTKNKNMAGKKILTHLDLNGNLSATGTVTGSNLSGTNNGDQTAAEILTAIKTVDGSGSGLDADLLDGLQLGTGRNNSANQVVRTQGNGYIDAGWINTTSGNTGNTITDIYVNTNDGYIRKATQAHFRSQVTDGSYPTKTGSGASGTWGINISGTATNATNATSSGTSSQLEAANTGNLNTTANSVTAGELIHNAFSGSAANKPPTSDNANSVITVGQHSGNYNAQLAFSSDGNMYWRDNPSTSFGSWDKIWDSSNLTNVSQLTNNANYVTSSGNTIIGTDSDINTSGNIVVDQLNMTDGVITSHSTRTLTLANLGYTGATNANYITNNNQLTNGASYITDGNTNWNNTYGFVTSSGNTIIGTDSDIDTSGATIIDNLYMTDGVITSHGTRVLTLGNLGFTGASNANYITNNNQLSNGAGYLTSYSNTWRGIDDSPVNGQTAESISSNWAYDHAASSTAHPRDTRNQASGNYAIKGSDSANDVGSMTTFNSNDSGASTGGDQSSLEIYNSTAGKDAFMQFHVAGDYATYFGLNGASNDLFVGGWSMGGAKNKIFHEGNFTDGSSNWNASFLWGNHASAGYLTSSSTQSKYLRSDANDVTNSNLGLNQDKKITFDSNADGFAYIRAISATDGNRPAGVLVYGSVDGHHFIDGEDDSYNGIFASAFNIDGGTASQFLKANGTLDSNTYLTSSSTQSKYLRSDTTDGTTGSLGVGKTNPILKLDIKSGTNNGLRISATDTTQNWRDISIRSYTSEAQADALPAGVHMLTTNPSGSTGNAFSKYGGFVIQCREDGNSSFAVRVGAGLAEAFFINHNAAAIFLSTVTATNFILSSDKRLKENIKKVDNKHIDVDWKTFEMKSDEGQSRYGVIAQELEEVHPEFVRTDDKGMKSVAYIDLLIAKIAELEARLDKANI